MSIPQKIDGDLAALDIAASNIVGHVRTMHHAAERDVPKMRGELRDKLQNFVNDVMATARDE